MHGSSRRWPPMCVSTSSSALPESTTSWVVRHEPPIRWRSGRDLAGALHGGGRHQARACRTGDLCQATTVPNAASISSQTAAISTRGRFPAIGWRKGICVCIGRSHRRRRCNDFPTSGRRRRGPEWMARQILSPQSPAVIFDAEHDRVQPWGGDRIFAAAVPVAETGQTSTADFRRAIWAAPECGVVSARSR